MWLAAASIHAQASAPGPATPVTSEFRVFDGTEDVTAPTDLRILPAGRRDSSAVEGAVETRAALIPLAPAMYDVQARRVNRNGVVAVKWTERLAVMHYPDEGDRHLEVINFQPGFGALQLRTTQGRLNTAEVVIFRSGDRTSPAGRPIAGHDYVLFVVRVGRYDVHVEHAEHGGAPDTHWLIGLDVPSDRTRLRLIDGPG